MNRTTILAPTHKNIQFACTFLRSSGILGIPTETVYGLAGSAFDEKALAQIFFVKERPTYDPLIIHVAASKSILTNPLRELQKQKLINGSKMSKKSMKKVETLIKTFWPGPLTLVLPKHPMIPDLVTSGLPTVALRMPRHPVAQKLLQTLDIPLAAPSANRFGRISPTCAEDVKKELGGRIQWILNGGTCEIGLESTIALIKNHGVFLLRPGAISKETIEKTLNEKIIEKKTSTKKQIQTSPGMLKNHYAPSKPLKILPDSVFSISNISDLLRDAPPCLGLLIQQGNANKAALKLSHLLKRKVIARSLSHHGCLEEIGKNLFSQLRFLDQSLAQALFVEPLKNTHGLGQAINDRLKKASEPLSNSA